jgi:hypothetical protein
LKLDNGSLAYEVLFVSLFHLGGQHLCPSLVLSFPREKGYYWEFKFLVLPIEALVLLIMHLVLFFMMRIMISMICIRICNCTFL